MIVATAGHIDHGKTLLVKTLTGVDTDRLPEEKARGISIDLGFAYLPLPGGGAIGFVDVPGHERFIRNMLAGVCGIDFALLVVAADDGVMPQTVEHLQILDLLHITRGTAVITKTDRVDVDRVRQVAENLQHLLAGTSLAGCTVLPVSAVTGAGMAELRQILESESRTRARELVAGQYFRMAIDRAFTVAGSGTVVTGTVFNGEVRSEEKLLVSPSGAEVRVRGLQKRGATAESAAAGERCALNLTGTGLGEIGRGDWVLAAPVHRPTRRIDARVTVLPSEAQPIRHWTPVHLHLATSDVTARVAIRRGAALAPGANDLVQLILDKPVNTLRGDRFILRDQSANRTLGGGFVIDPLPTAGRRRSAEHAAELAALEEADAGAALARLLREPAYHLDLARFETLYNLVPARAREYYQAAGLVQLGKEHPIGVTRERHGVLQQAVLAQLANFHRAQPQAAGADVEALRAQVAPAMSAEGFLALLRELVDARKIETSGSHARLPGHNATANAADETLWQQVRPALESAGYSPPPVKELAAQLQIKEPVLRDFLHRKSRGGDVQKVGAERFYPRSTLAALASLAQTTAQQQANGLFTAAQYRDATGTGRTLAIEILEHLDRLGITQRMGDARKMRRDYVPLLGAAPAIKAAPKPAARPAGAAARAPAQRPFQAPRKR